MRFACLVHVPGARSYIKLRLAGTHVQKCLAEEEEEEEEASKSQVDC